ncbi:hypothetical protein ACFXA3_14275 [Streptomyces sp. NPDC059456]|uniref:hypothetical protein n=1 Tax=Streptomyces sp. NPDC059456 TaxID=3346838 RepID=UPI0036B840E5
MPTLLVTQRRRNGPSAAALGRCRGCRLPTADCWPLAAGRRPRRDAGAHTDRQL